MKLIKKTLNKALSFIEKLEKKENDRLAREDARGMLEADVIGYYSKNYTTTVIAGITYDVVVNNPATIVRAGKITGPYAYKCTLSTAKPTIVINNAARNIDKEQLDALLELTAKTPAKGGLDSLCWQEVVLLDGSITNQDGLVGLLKAQLQDHPDYQERLELAQSRVRSRA